MYVLHECLYIYNLIFWIYVYVEYLHIYIHMNICIWLFILIIHIEPLLQVPLAPFQILPSRFTILPCWPPRASLQPIFFLVSTMAWKKLCNDKSLARSIQVTEQDEKTLAGWQDGYIQLMPTKIKRNKNSNLQHTTKNSEGFLFFPGFAGGNRHVESATAWWRTCEFFSMARLREVSLLLIGFLGIVAICHLAAALREKYPSGSPRCHKATNAASEERSHLST